MKAFDECLLLAKLAEPELDRLGSAGCSAATVRREVALTEPDNDNSGSNARVAMALPSDFQPCTSSMPLPEETIQQLTPAALAYLGDAVYELYVRHWYLLPPKRLQSYHSQVVSQVRAERQAEHLRSLIPLLTDVELDLVKRGRNAVTGHPKRVDPATYQQATSLETLIGYLHLTNPQRLAQLLAQLELDTPI